MKVMIGGGGGFIGQRLARFFLQQGLEVVILDRNEPKMQVPLLVWFTADLLKPRSFDKQWFAGVDAFINLSGKDIFTLWNEKNKKAIWESRVTVNKNLFEFMSSLKQRPHTFISASAVGYYGDKGDREIDETASHGNGFLADVCVAWEREARRMEELGMRSIQIRTAPVLDKKGGIMGQLMKSMKYGLTLRFGSGNNWFPWIHMEDLIAIYHESVSNEKLSGPVNAASPHPVQFREFLNKLIEFHKAVVLPFPVSVLRMFIKETADVLTFSQKMVPTKLQSIGFQFAYPSLQDAFKQIFLQ